MTGDLFSAIQEAPRPAKETDAVARVLELLTDPRVHGAVGQAIASTDHKQVAAGRRGRSPQPGSWRDHHELAAAALVAAKAEAARILGVLE